MEMADDVGHCYPAESKVALLCYRNNANVLGMGYCRPPQGLPNNKTSTFGAQTPTQGLPTTWLNLTRSQTVSLEIASRVISTFLRATFSGSSRATQAKEVRPLSANMEERGN